LKYLLILFFATTIVFGAAGKNGFAFLKNEVDARSAALGGAGSAMAAGPSALYWNPAALRLASDANLLFSHAPSILDISHDFAAFQFLTGNHSAGIFVNVTNIPGNQIRNTVPDEEPLGEINAINFVAGLGYARSLLTDWHYGLTVKYLYEKYYLSSAWGLAMDAGLLKKDLIYSIDAALSVQNLGLMTVLEKESTNLPLLIRGGLAWDTKIPRWQHPFLVSGELLYLPAENLKFGLGAEWQPVQYLALRSGLKLSAGQTRLTAGAGIRYGTARFDYSYLPMNEFLGASHLFTLQFGF
jgi:hypothetical protein